MISIDRLEEMVIEELQTELKNFKEQIKLQNNFIDSLLKATNNSEWLDKSMLDDEVSEVIEKIELDYAQLDQLKVENNKYSLFIEKLCDYAGLECDDEEQAMRTLSDLASQINKARWIIDRYKQTLTEIKEIAEVLITITDEYDNCYHKSECNKCLLGINGDCQYFKVEQILQKISECEVE